MTSVDSQVREVRSTARQRFLDLREISRPGLWVMSLVPFYVGHLLATKQLMFGQSTCFPPNSHCVQTIWPVLIGFAVWGPLVWLAVLAINDAYDLPGDLLNPRKDTPLTSGRLSESGAKIAAYAAAGLAVLLSLAVRPGLAVAALGFIVCGWIYSVPPLKFKNRPGLDIISNCLALGAFPLLGGWAVARPLNGFPWIVLAVGVLVNIALYMPTMIADYESDKASGYTTTAVRFGPNGAYLIGLVSMAGYWIITIVLSARDEVFPHKILWIQVVAAPILIWTYHRFLSRAREPLDILRGMLMVGRLFLVAFLAFALTYTAIL